MPRLMSPPPVTEIRTSEQAQALRNIILTSGLVSFDTETTGLNAHRVKPVVVSMSTPAGKWQPEWGSQDVFGEYYRHVRGNRFVFEASNYEVCPILIPALEEPGVSVVAHNYSYDAHILRRFWDVTPGKNGVVYDTQQLDFLSDENRLHGLKECCEDYGVFFGMRSFRELFGSVPEEYKELLSPSEYALQFNREKFLDYAGTDAYATLLLFYHLRDALKKKVWKDPRSGKDSEFLTYYLEFEHKFVSSVFEMESTGVVVAPERLQPYKPKLLKRLSEIEGYYAHLAGKIVNLNSTDQVGALFFGQLGLPVYKKTKGGKTGVRKPALNAEALEVLVDEGHEDVVGPLMEYRKLDKLLSTYVEGLDKHILPDGRIHGSFNTHVTVTGRLSSSEPNLQNIENKDEEDEDINEYDIRAAFVARPGHKLIVADYKTLEIMITAHISQDQNMIEALTKGLDQHAFTAALMFGNSYEEVLAAKNAETPTPEQKVLIKRRKDAKSITFGILYGMSAHSLATRLKIELAEAEDYINRFYKAYPGILQAKNYWTQHCEIYGYVLTVLGRRRHIPTIWSSKKYARSRAERQLFNAMIQGSGGCLMREYMPALVNSPVLKELGAKLVLQIHDEVVVECPEENAEAVRAEVVRILESALSFIPWAVPIKCDASIADNWSEGK